METKSENIFLKYQWVHYRCGILHALKAGVVEDHECSEDPKNQTAYWPLCGLGLGPQTGSELGLGYKLSIQTQTRLGSGSRPTLEGSTQNGFCGSLRVGPRVEPIRSYAYLMARPSRGPRKVTIIWSYGITKRWEWYLGILVCSYR